MILLLECPGCLCISKRQESCSGRRLGSAEPSTAPSLLSQLWLDTAGTKQELHSPWSGETTLLVHSTSGKVPHFYSPVLKKLCWGKAPSTSHGQAHAPVHGPRTVTALNINVRGQVLLCSPDPTCPEEQEAVMGITGSGAVALLLSAHTSPRSALCSPGSLTSPGEECSAPREPPPPFHK